MNIKDMPYKEYYYNFEIDCIKQAFPIIDSLKYSINEYQNINLQDKEQIKTYAKDFKEVSNRLITREGITDYTDYENSIKTLAIINAKIQATIYIYNLQNIDINIENYCKRINSLLAFTHTAKDIFMQNHSTKFILILISVILATLITFSIYTNNINLLTISVLLLLLYFITVVLLLMVIRHYNSLNKINKILNNNTFLNSRKIKLYSNKFYKLLKYINSNKH